MKSFVQYINEKFGIKESTEDENVYEGYKHLDFKIPDYAVSYLLEPEYFDEELFKDTLATARDLSKEESEVEADRLIDKIDKFVEKVYRKAGTKKGEWYYTWDEDDKMFDEDLYITNKDIIDDDDKYSSIQFSRMSYYYK